ncbi:chemokine XC receptor 1-like [Pseudorasbora parva]|uniref:chemokine XC receptor 1-like n=1 Tax=Pseudorasbora parva TaxID=51549 RepID=UPI00351E6654
MNCTTSGASTNSTTFLTFLDNYEMWIFSINVVFGLPTHSYVLWLIVSGTGRRVASEIFMLNLCCCEIFICVDFFFFTLSGYIANLLPLALILQGVAMTGRPVFQCLMCVERYLAVVHPVTFLKYKPLRYRVICCTAAWVITFGSCLVCLMIFLLFTFTVHTWFYTLQFLLFLFIQLFCLVAVLRALKQSGPGERGREREEENHMKRRAFYLILITTVAMVMTYVPFTIAGFITILAHPYYVSVWCPALFYVLASFVQPVHYLHQAGKLSCLCSSKNL